jgi:hypothetical protein
MAVQTSAINMDKLNAFLGQVVGELGATVNAGLIVLGDRLGLYKAMAGAGPISSGELAAKTGTAERSARMAQRAPPALCRVRPGDQALSCRPSGRWSSPTRTARRSWAAFARERRQVWR